MRISAKGRYALAALIQISNKESAAMPVSIISISESLGVSKLFLEQIAANLKKEKLITAVKGAKGGYQLAKSPSDITVLDVLKSVETSLFETAQGEPLDKAPVISDAISALVFAPLDNAVENCLSEITLRDLQDYTTQHGDSQSYMLYI